MTTGGLDEVIAAETVLSDVDGERGRLTIRGFALAELAESPFEEVISLLWRGFFTEAPTAAALGRARRDTFAKLVPHLPLLATLDVFDGMRAAVALLSDGDAIEDALRLVAAPAVLVPALLRSRRGDRVVEPDPAAPHATDVLRMLGAPVELAPALDTYLVTVADHGLNASTFAARVVASTRAGLVSAVLAGLGALKGPLHGGAPGPVIEMLDAIAARGDARAWLEEAFERGERLMGFGHRIYRVRDPRADALKAAVRRIGTRGDRLAFAESVERVALGLLHERKPDRVLETNVEFYTALLLEALRFPPETFTAVFAMGRTVGWIAHAREQRATGRLIRPRSRYVGP